VIAIALLCAASAQTPADSADAAADWPMYNRDLAGTRYSPWSQETVVRESSIRRGE